MDYSCFCDQYEIYCTELFKCAISMYVYSFVVFVAGVIGGQMFYTLKNIISIILQFSPVILYIFYQTYNQYILNKLAKKFLCIWLLISLYTIYVYFYIGDIGRLITARQYSGTEFALGGISIATASVLIALYLLECVFNKKFVTKLRYKIFYYVYIFVSSVVVYISGSMICFLILCGIGFLIIFPIRNKWSLVYVIIFALLIIDIFRVSIGENIIAFSDSLTDRIAAYRVASIGYAISHGGVSEEASYFFMRLGRPLLSLETFIHNPFFGVAYKYGNYYPDAYKYGIGCHGEWADIIAMYGLCGFAYLLAIWSSIKSYVVRGYIKEIPKWAWAFLLMGMVNPVMMITTTTISFFLIPGLNNVSCVCYARKRKRKKDEENIVYS